MRISNPMMAPGRPVSDGRLVGLLGDWAQQGHGSLARRLAQGLRTAITGGMLESGSRLPPERQIAAVLSVSRSTVSSALDELRAEGLLRSRQGSGTEVVGVGAPVPMGGRVDIHFAREVAGIDLGAVLPAVGDHLPDLTLTTADLVAAKGLLEPEGMAPLRAAIAAHASGHGLPTTPEQIQVTHGAHHAIALAVDALMTPGASIVLENPTYPGMLDLIDQRRARPLALRTDGGGADPQHLDHLLRTERPAVVYFQGGPHNPTGVVTGPARRRALAEVLDRHPGTIVLDDETLAGLETAGVRPPGMAELCQQAQVLTIGSLSKVVWAPLRIGWIRVDDPLRRHLGRVRIASDLGASAPSQLLALRVLPDLDTIAAARRASLARATADAVDALAALLPDWEIRPPDGSSAMWPALPVSDTSPFVALARRHGVRVTPGSAHFVGGVDSPHLRFCVDRPADQVAEGIERLAAAWADATTRRGALG